MKAFIYKYVVAIAIALSFSLASIAFAADFTEFKKIANETIKQAKSGDIKNIDQLIAMQNKLINIGKSASKSYGATNPKASKMMKLIVAQADTMKSMSLSQIEAQWHEKAFLKGKGIPPALLAEKSKTGSYMDTVVHPATTFILLSEFKTTKDKKLLQQVIGELEEVLHHVDAL